MATSVELTGRRRRPGGRSARVRAAVLQATLEELVDVGYAQLSLDAVARRAGVHKTTVYRRWGSREALVLELMRERAAQEVPIPDTGSLRGDLVELATSATRNAASPPIEAVIRATIGALRHDQALGELAATFWSERLALDGEIVTRAIDRGEVPAGTDPSLVIEAVLGPLHLRLLAGAAQPDSKFIEETVGLVVRGVSADS
jgi:AcrR family transcriptional regulator